MHSRTSEKARERRTVDFRLQTWRILDIVQCAEGEEKDKRRTLRTHCSRKNQRFLRGAAVRHGSAFILFGFVLQDAILECPNQCSGYGRPQAVSTASDDSADSGFRAAGRVHSTDTTLV